MKVAVSRAPGAERVVTPLELFFDLVYVFALGQLSHHLLEHVDLRTAAETVILALAVVYGWYMTAWAMNWLEPDRLPVRVLLVGLMFASLLMSVAIGDAFDGRAWLFVSGYLVLQLGRLAFLIVALRGLPLGEHFVNDLAWDLLAGSLWIAGAIADGDARLVLWGLAVVTAYSGVFALHWLPGRGRRIDLGHADVAGAHLIERFRLFFLIALGETVITHDPHLRRAGALPARPDHLQARGGRGRSALPATGPGRARDSRGRHVAAHDDRRDHRVERRARSGGDCRHGGRTRSKACVSERPRVGVARYGLRDHHQGIGPRFSGST